MIDFAALALGPGLSAFGRPVTVMPLPAQPPIAPFAATGVWAVRNVDVPALDGESVNTIDITLGIRLADWPLPPRPRMRVRVPAAGGLPDEGTLWIDDVDPDGQGGARLVLKRQPPEA